MDVNKVFLYTRLFLILFYLNLRILDSERSYKCSIDFTMRCIYFVRDPSLIGVIQLLRFST